MAMPDETAPDASLDGIGYADAVAELEEILEQLDGDEIDVDHLAAQVRRASELITLCRSRLSSARMEVTRIVADLDAVAAVSAPTSSPDESDESDESDDDPTDDDPIDDTDEVDL